jgi:hypothetical protein
MFQLTDLRARFERLAAAGAISGVALERFELGAQVFEAIRLEPDRFWDDRDVQPFLVLVLEGVGSIHLDDWRSSVAGGHMVEVPAEVRARFLADGGLALLLLVMRPAGQGTDRLRIGQAQPDDLG